MKNIFKIIPIDIIIVFIAIYVVLPPFIASKPITLTYAALFFAYFIYLFIKGNLTKIILIMAYLYFGTPSMGSDHTGAITYILPTTILSLSILGILKKLYDAEVSAFFQFGKSEILLLLFFLLLNFIDDGIFYSYYNLFIISFFANRIIVCRSNINADELFVGFRVLLFIQFVVIILERVFFYRAYPSVFEDSSVLEALRCSGYTGHPLVLSSFFIMYAILLFIISSWKNKFYIIDTIILVICCIFLSSRTPLIIILLVCISSFLLYIRHNIFKALLVILTMVISFTYIINNSEMANIYMDTSERIENSGADQRLGAFEITKKVIEKEPLGIGLYDQDVFIKKLNQLNINSTDLFSVDMAVIDNSFLTSLISFGVFGLFIFHFFFAPIVHSYKILDKRITKISLCMIVCIFIMINFSFDMIIYQYLMLLFFVYTNLIVTIDKSKIIQEL